MAFVRGVRRSLRGGLRGVSGHRILRVRLPRPFALACAARIFAGLVLATVCVSSFVSPPAVAQLPREGARDLDVRLVGSAAGRLVIEVVAEERLRGIEQRPAGDRTVVEMRTARRLRLPWSHREIGADLVAGLELRSVRGGLELVVRHGPGFGGTQVETGVEGRSARIVVLGRSVGATSEALTLPADRPWVVVVDPGHGGQEDGAVGASGLKEKDVVLDIGRRLVALLRAEGFDARLTRDEDIALSLDTRAAIANNARADLFVSLHVNASTSKRAHGAETFILSRDATDDEARTLAALENGASGVAAEQTSGATSDLPLILWDMAQVAYLADSHDLAETIQDRLNEAHGLENRGVRQAPFRVLVGATCPAVLVETGFMSNRREEELLATAAYRRELAETLATAIAEFRESREGDARPSLGFGPPN